jgi:hypothetical protein
MAPPTVWIKELSRQPEHGPEDRLAFTTGVNVVVGPPNTGKTKWLQILDYLMGNDGRPEEVLGDEVFAKYDLAEALLVVSGQEMRVQRRWKQAGARTKVFVDDDSLNLKDYLGALMTRLSIPVIHYPQGDPYGDRTWPELGWRSLYRHVYRRQTFWGDIADRQPESEQHACLLQFLGIAEHLFSAQYGSLVEKEKAIRDLRVARDQFLSMLHEMSREIVGQEELGVAVTPQSIDAALQRTQTEIQSLERQRQVTLTALIEAVSPHLAQPSSPSGTTVEEMGQRLADLRARQDIIAQALNRTQARLTELEGYRNTLEEELGRLERAQQAGAVLADLKITHCPACDREIDQPGSEDDQQVCYVCKRALPESLSGGLSAKDRLELEMEQLKGEVEEANDLRAALSQDLRRLQDDRATVAAEVDQLQQMLRPIRTAAAAVLPPEIAVFDMKIGQLQERLQQLARVRQSLQRRETLSQQISQIQQEVAALEQQVAQQSRLIEFDHAGDLLSDGMNTYLNMIRQTSPTSWTQEAIRVHLEERRFRINVGNARWQSKLGGTLTLYFLIAYHFGLMSLVDKPSCHFPGLVVLDFPAELEDGSTVADKENFVLEPFVTLLGQEAFQSCQVIAAGVAFQNLVGANRTELTKIWK